MIAEGYAEAIAQGYPEGMAKRYARRYAEGVTKGMVKGLLRVLAACEIVLSDSDREHITTCDDAAQLELWLKRAALVSTAEELFA
ncbi:MULTISPECIES: hypothetical protein [unclassified Nonomuraea]|uniref:hypothetical protein n=1 Tax=unclassified Nonomuraea TaxID=2593643 RepID=UPI0033F4ABE1